MKLVSAAVCFLAELLLQFSGCRCVGIVTGGAFAEDGFFGFRQPTSVLADDGRHLWVIHKVHPLMRIVFVVVKLFGSVQKVDVTPAGRTDRMISTAEGGECRVVPFSRRIFEERFYG